MPTLAEVMTAVQGIQQKVEAQDVAIKELSKPATGNQAVKDALNAPNVRRGENTLTSRGYSFLKLLGYCAGYVPAEQCRVELELHNDLQKSLVQNTGMKKAESNTILSPFSSKHLGLEDSDTKLVSKTRDLVSAGVAGYDPEEAFNYRMKYWGREKALSWVDETVGGALVAPPMMGELIELLRNNEALLAAGARDIGMPPQGRITFPAQLSASTAYWVGENTTITDTAPGTGDTILTAKKLGVMCKIPNELFRFASVSIEQFVREDIARVMALKLDKTLLEGVGASVAPKGIINYANVSNYTTSTNPVPKSLGTNGNTLMPEDVGNMIAVVEEVNATFGAWIMRPSLYNGLLNRRADGVIPGDGAGPFLFNMFREWESNMRRERGMGALQGYPVVKTTQVSNVRSKGSASNLTYLLGGNFHDFIIALGGVIEFLVANQGDTMVANDQTWIRGIQYVDGAPRHEASFVYYDTLLNS